MRNRFGSILRAVLVILMGATTVMTLLGAVGTTCIAWNADRYGASLAVYVPWMTTYQLFVEIKLATAVAMALVVFAIVRGARWFYVGGLLTCVIGLGVAAAQMYLASSLRHVPFLATPPTNIRFFITAVTLLAFLFIRIPGIWDQDAWRKRASGPGSASTPAGLALSVAGLLMLTTPWWAGPSHVLDGYNLVETMAVPLVVDGTLILIAGLVCLAFGRWRVSLGAPRHRKLQEEAE